MILGAEVVIDGTIFAIGIALIGGALGLGFTVTGFFINRQIARGDRTEEAVALLKTNLALAKNDIEHERTLRKLRGETTNPGYRNPLF